MTIAMIEFLIDFNRFDSGSAAKPIPSQFHALEKTSSKMDFFETNVIELEVRSGGEKDPLKVALFSQFFTSHLVGRHSSFHFEARSLFRSPQAVDCCGRRKKRKRQDKGRSMKVLSSEEQRVNLCALPLSGIVNERSQSSG